MGWHRKQGNLKKGYQRSKKERYTGSKRFDGSCCNHGSCPVCEGNRTIKNLKIEQKFEDDDITIEDYKNVEFA